jgi:hypothetical protein
LGKYPCRKLFTLNSRGEKGLKTNPKFENFFFFPSFFYRVLVSFSAREFKKVTLNTIRKQKHVGKPLQKRKLRGGGGNQKISELFF